MAKGTADLQKKLVDRIRLGIELYNKFFNARSDREKQMILVLGVLGLLFLDYWLLIHPVVKTLTTTVIESSGVHEEWRSLKEDRANEAKILQEWKKSLADLEEKERRFIAPHEMPMFLENLSRLAGESGVKILTVKPDERPAAGKKEEAASYAHVPIQVSALGGAHEIGKFLAKLESSRLFMSVTELRISPNVQDPKRHLLSLGIVGIRKEPLK